MSTPLTLPDDSDVLRRIFNEIPGDLKQCSLVCRSWTPAATSHLFHSLTVDAFRLVHRPLSGRDDTTRIFRDFLDEARQSPRISSSVRKLTLRGNWEVTQGSEIITNYASGRWLDCPLDTLQDILSTLLNLQDLHIVGLRVIATANSSLSSSVESSRRSLDSLYVPYIRGHFSNLLCCFDEIHKLDVEDYNGPGLGEATPVGLPAVQTSVLEIAGPRPKDVVSWSLSDEVRGREGFRTMMKTLRAALDLSKLEQIEIDQDYYIQEEFVQFLAKCPALETLRVRGTVCKPTSFSMDSKPDAACAQLLCCHNLRSFHVLDVRLCFYAVTAAQGHTVKKTWARVCTLLAGVPTTVTKVELDLSLKSFHFSEDCERWELGRLDWEALDRELSRLDSLRCARFKLRENRNFEQFVFMMRTKLSERARKRVYVERCVESGSFCEPTAETRSRILSSMDAVDQHAGITVLRTDEDSFRQELLLLDKPLPVSESRRRFWQRRM